MLYDKAADVIEGLSATISKMEKTTRWIPVSEKLPDVPGTYLVLVKEPTKFTERRIKGEVEEWENFDFSHVEPVFYNNDQCIWDDDDIPMNANIDVVNTYEAFHVTHWMPLPEPPKEVLTGTDMRGGIRRDDAGNVIDWGITGPPGDVGKTEEE